MHPPKSAGSSVSEAIISTLGLPKQKWRPLPRAGWVMVHDHLPEWHAEKQTSRLRRARYVHGHFDFNTYDSFAKPDDRLFTFLREPTDRLFSTYQFWRSREDAPMPADPVADFADFLFDETRRYRRHIDNGLVRMMSGNFRKEIGSPAEWETAAALARENLGRFDFVGHQSRFDEHMALLFEKLELPGPYRPTKVNVTPAPWRKVVAEIRGQQLPGHVMERIEQLTRYDREFHQFAVAA